MSATTFLRRRNYAGDTCKNEEFPAATFGKEVCIFRYLGVAKNIFVGRYSLLAVITDYDSWYAAKVVESMVVDLDPLRLSG